MLLKFLLKTLHRNFFSYTIITLNKNVLQPIIYIPIYLLIHTCLYNSHVGTNQ